MSYIGIIKSQHAITRWSRDVHLISDKININYCLFPRGQDFSLGIRLTRLTIPQSAGSFKGKAFSFPLSGPCTAWLWNLGFFRIPNYVFIFHRTKKQLLLCLTLRRIISNSLCVFTLWRIIGNCLVSIVWKITTCWVFWWFIPQCHSWSPVCFSADAYMANKGWGSPMLMSPCTK